MINSDNQPVRSSATEDHNKGQGDFLILFLEAHSEYHLQFFPPKTVVNRHSVTFNMVLGDLKHCAFLILGEKKEGVGEGFLVHLLLPPRNSAPNPV